MLYKDGSAARVYRHASTPSADAAPGSAGFETAWLRGEGRGFALEVGDRVELRFGLDGDALPPRTAVTLQLIPEMGRPAEARFWTPETYGDGSLVELR